jgi:peptidoglycan hydrolase CwlO-like protein
LKVKNLEAEIERLKKQYDDLNERYNRRGELVAQLEEYARAYFDKLSPN